MSELLWIGVPTLVYAVLRFKPEWIDRAVVVVAGRALGRAAVAAQPDAIRLVPRGGPPSLREARSAIESLVRRGFEAAGSFTVVEMDALPVHFLLKPDEAAIAAIYEHPQAGVWCDIASRHDDGSSFTVTNARLGGSLEATPGHLAMRAPGLTAAALHIRFTRDRPAGPWIDPSPAELPWLFEQAYAAETAWRKERGISRAEVLATAREGAGWSPA